MADTSRVGAENRKKIPGVDYGMSSYVRHTGGSVNFAIHQKRLETQLGKTPTPIDLFERVHKRNKGKGEWCDGKAEKVASKYHETIKEKHMPEIEIADDEITDDEIAIDVDPRPELPFDPEAWVNAIGVPKKNKVYGFGLTQEADKVHSHATSFSTMPHIVDTSTQVNNEDILELREENARLRDEVHAFKLEMEEIKKTLYGRQNTMPPRE